MTSAGLSWWANRKSQLGLRPLAVAPPHLPGGKPWWTTPPTAVPQPEHIEFVAEFQRQLQADRRDGRTRQDLLKYVADWLRVARRLLHEEIGSVRGFSDLQTTDGIVIASSVVIHQLAGLVHRLGGKVPAELQPAIDSVHGRADKMRRERAIARGAKP